MSSSPSRDEQRAREQELLAILAARGNPSPPSAQAVQSVQAARDELVVLNLGLVRHLARTFPGIPQEDLMQAGTLGLLAAIDAYDPSFDNTLGTFATHHILGEMRQFVRTQAWALKVPRRVQDLARDVARARTELAGSLGRSPTVTELSEHLQVTPEAILDALEASSARYAGSIDDSDESPAPGAVDPSFTEVEDRETVLALLATLPDRERQIVLLTYYERMSQAQIAERLGISQMHVSRLHGRAMAAMRGAIED